MNAEADPTNRAIDAIKIDAERHGGRLELEQVERVLDRRNLTSEECIDVIRQLIDAGVVSPPGSDSKNGDIPEIEGDTTESSQFELEFDNSGLTSEDLAENFEAQVRRMSTVAIGEHGLLSATEEKTLGRAIKLAAGVREDLSEGRIAESSETRAILARGDQARTRMILMNLRLVMKSANRYASMTSLDVEDLFQQGIFGLMRAVAKFDHTLGYKFSTYATWWIMQSMTRYIADAGETIRLPVHLHEKLTKLRRAVRVLTMFNERRPTLVELADEIDGDPGQVQFLLDIAGRRMVELDRPVTDDESLTIGDLLPNNEPTPEEYAADLDARRAILEVMSCLTQREKVILIKRFGLNYDRELTLEELGQEFGVTRERIRQIEAIALKKLRHPARREPIQELIPLSSQDEPPKDDGEQSE